MGNIPSNAYLRASITRQSIIPQTGVRTRNWYLAVITVCTYRSDGTCNGEKKVPHILCDRIQVLLSKIVQLILRAYLQDLTKQTKLFGQGEIVHSPPHAGKKELHLSYLCIMTASPTASSLPLPKASPDTACHW